MTTGINDGFVIWGGESGSEALVVTNVYKTAWINIQQGKDLICIPKDMIPDLIKVFKKAKK